MVIQSHSMLPRHIAIIMDGNGRWAKKRNLPRVEGHRRGADSVRDITRAAREVGIQALTLYAFSSQNWERPVEEVRMLMALLRDYLVDERQEILGNDIRLETIGDLERLPDFVREPLDALKNDSKNNKSMVLTLALSYGPVRNSEGKTVSTFQSIWRKEGKGKWKVIFDKGCPVCETAKP